MQCYVIITTRSLCWLLLTLVSTLAILSALFTPRWIIGPTRTYNIPHNNLSPYVGDEDLVPNTRNYANTLGLFTRCKLIKFREHCASIAGVSSAEGGAGIPGVWQASLFFLVIGLSLSVLTTLAALLSCCVQAVCAKKSIFNVAGVAQGVAGVLYIIAFMLFPFGFASNRVQKVCSVESEAFYLADCHLGWSFYIGVAGVIGTFICAIISHQAELATSSRKVEAEINEGKNLICLI